MSKYAILKTSKFKKDYKKIKSRPDFNEEEFTLVIEKLSNGEKLLPKYRNHLLVPKSERYMGMSYIARFTSNL